MTVSDEKRKDGSQGTLVPARVEEALTHIPPGGVVLVVGRGSRPLGQTMLGRSHYGTVRRQRIGRAVPQAR